MCTVTAFTRCPQSLALSLAFTLATHAATQPNSWTKPTSGNWEEPYWSLGVLPGPDQRIMITNGGWKAVAIAASTVQNFPQRLNVHSVTVLSPIDSFNTLLLNYAGTESPLTVSGSLTIGSNAALTMLSSAVRLAGPPGSGLSVGGQVNHREFSRVTGGQLDVGWAGPGLYRLISGVVDVGHIFVGGPYGGVINQNGGILSADILHMENGGTYNLRGGDFDALTYTSDGSVFRQNGGYVYRQLEFFRGQYLLTNGVNFGGIKLPVGGNFATNNGSATAYQEGGTNFGPIQVGFFGDGNYWVNGGLVQSPEITIGRLGTFYQTGGTVSTPATITVHGDYFGEADYSTGWYGLIDGFVSCAGIDLDTGSYTQNGGTNVVAGVLAVGPGTDTIASTDCWLMDGLLITENTRLAPAASGGFIHVGGTHRIANELSIAGEAVLQEPQTGKWIGYFFEEGELIVSNIVIYPRSVLSWRDGRVTQSGTIRLIGGKLNAGYIAQQFGRLQLEVSGSDTDSRLYMQYGTVRFRNSSTLTWSGGARFIISNWKGSPQGGGANQIVFGNSASALTASQLSKIFFENPGGIIGLYAARILPNGEVVPDMQTGPNPPRVTIRKRAAGLMELTVTGDAGANYGILRSPNLTDWAFWTNRLATNGAISALDSATPNQPKLFYRAVLMQ